MTKFKYQTRRKKYHEMCAWHIRALFPVEGDGENGVTTSCEGDPALEGAALSFPGESVPPGP